MTRIATLRCAAWLFLGASAYPLALEGQGEYEVGPVPSWVTELFPALDRPLPAGAVPGGSELLLIDRQDRVGSVRESFFHLAYRLVDEAAVQGGSQIEISLDPTYQTLVLHTIRVTRSGESVDQLPVARIQVVQRETRMEYQIYDGSQSVVVLLPDIRPDDIIEYSYTLRGSNPVFEDHYFASFAGQLEVPVDRMHFRVLWPRGRTLFLRADDAMPQPTIQETGQYREYVWDRADAQPRLVDSDLPPWFDPLPTVQLSDFEDWGEVATWGQSLFDLTLPLPVELETWLADLRSRETSAAGQALASLRFVQDEVRYLGIELGVNSHLPYPPATVMQRRYGDCKDKSLLLIAMLRELGIEAHPVLVSTVYGEHLGDFHPTASLFDHAIVRVRVDDAWYFMDPTILHQRGDLEEVSPGYGSVLVLADGIDSLVRSPSAPASEPSIEIGARFALGDVGSVVTAEIRSAYRGPSATSMRQTIRNNSTEQLQQGYVEYYAGLYPSIESTRGLEVEDDEDNNVVRTIETYSIPDFWDQPEGSEVVEGEFYAMELADAIGSPTTVNRTMPLGVSHRTHIRYTIEATFAEGWSISPELESLDTEATRFEYRVSAEGDVLTLSWEYETLADHVTAERAADHIRSMERAADLLGYSIVIGSEVADEGFNSQEINWLVLFTAMFMAAACGLGSVRMYRLQPQWPHGPSTTIDGPQGIGGWLILVALGVTVSPFLIFADFASTLPSYSVSTWSILTTPGTEAYHSAWAPLLIFEIFVNVVLFSLAIVLLIAFYRRKSLFPALFIAFLMFQITMTWIDASLSNMIPYLRETTGAMPLVQPSVLLTSALWIAYMFRSKRVRNTFVN